jgi:hypothetical protein
MVMGVELVVDNVIWYVGVWPYVNVPVLIAVCDSVIPPTLVPVPVPTEPTEYVTGIVTAVTPVLGEVAVKVMFALYGPCVTALNVTGLKLWPGQSSTETSKDPPVVKLVSCVIEAACVSGLLRHIHIGSPDVYATVALKVIAVELLITFSVCGLFPTREIEVCCGISVCPNAAAGISSAKASEKAILLSGRLAASIVGRSSASLNHTTLACTIRKIPDYIV